MNTRPRGLIEPATPVTIADPYSVTQQRQESMRLAARAEAAEVESIEYTPATPRDLAKIRQGIELAREAANRGVRLRALGGAVVSGHTPGPWRAVKRAQPIGWAEAAAPTMAEALAGMVRMYAKREAAPNDAMLPEAEQPVEVRAAMRALADAGVSA